MPPPDPALLSINTATLRAQWALPQIIDGLVRHGIRGISPWRDQVVQAGLKSVAQRIRDAGLVVSGYCRGGTFTAPDRDERRAALDEHRRAVDEAAAIDARCLILGVGGLPKDRRGEIVSRDLIGAREMVRDGIGELLEYARAAGMPLAIEPSHPMYAADRACVNTIAHANDLCDELAPSGKDGLGIAVDVYHVWWDPQLKAQVERAGAHERLFAYQICDWLVPTTSLVEDRGMMGDGVIDLPLVRSWIEAAGFRGMHDVEVLSANDWWKRDGDEVLLTCRRRHESRT